MVILHASPVDSCHITYLTNILIHTILLRDDEFMLLFFYLTLVAAASTRSIAVALCFARLWIAPEKELVSLCDELND